MPLSLYDVSVPVMVKGFKAMSTVLQRGVVFAAGTGASEEALLTKRLWPDMMPLTGQIQRASDTARFAAVRVGQARDVPMPDTETSFDALRQRIDATIAFLERVDRKGYDGRETAEVVLPAPRKPIHYSGRDYVLEFAVPNFWFHVTTAYDILRASGVPVGKRHFLGWE